VGETFNPDEYARYHVLEVLQTAYARSTKTEEKIRHLRHFMLNLSYVLDHPATPAYEQVLRSHCRWGEEEVTRMTLGHPDEIIDPALEKLIQDALIETHQNI
jgi:hypothetical protein